MRLKNPHHPEKNPEQHKIELPKTLNKVLHAAMAYSTKHSSTLIDWLKKSNHQPSQWHLDARPANNGAVL